LMPTTKTVHSLVIDGRSADNNNRVVVGCGFIKNGGSDVKHENWFDCELATGTGETYDLAMEKPVAEMFGHDVYVAIEWHGAKWHDLIKRVPVDDGDVSNCRFIDELLYAFSFVINTALRSGLVIEQFAFIDLEVHLIWTSPTELGIKLVPWSATWTDDDGNELMDIDAYIAALPVEPFGIITPNVAS